jgi:hypothetical protein
VPEEFLYDPVSKSYGDPSRRPECKSATIEFIAPSEYMLRPPQPAVYIFCLDVSRSAVETGYLKVFCDILADELEKLPGDSRTQVGFITYDRVVHFYSLPDGATQPTQLTVCDIDGKLEETALEATLLLFRGICSTMKSWSIFHVYSTVTSTDVRYWIFSSSNT